MEYRVVDGVKMIKCDCCEDWIPVIESPLWRKTLLYLLSPIIILVGFVFET